MGDLPLEILFTIIGQVANERESERAHSLGADDSQSKRTLASCSLVSPALTARSQRALFSTMRITHLASLKAMLEGIPHVASWIVSLKLLLPVLEDPDLPGVLPSLQNVRSLTLDLCRGIWGAIITPGLLSALQSSIFPSITHLYLQNILFLPFAVITCPDLRDLSVYYVTSQDVTELEEPVWDPSPRALRSLDLGQYEPGDFNDNASLMRFLSHSEIQLESITFRGLPVEHDFWGNHAPFTSRFKQSLKIFHGGPLYGQ